MTTLTFIWHDCFLLETPKIAVVFDFWKDGRRRASSEDIPRFLPLIPKEKHLYVLVSHHHKDHFHRSIFLWEQVHPKISFIISTDTRRSIAFMLRPSGTYTGFRPSPEKVIVLGQGETFSDTDITVKAYGSTDIGNSYLVTVPDGRKVFHAGDLNAWVWKNESTPEEIDEAESAFMSVTEQIAADCPEIDIAMFPVDSRIGRDYWEGAAMFVRSIFVKKFFPMHFCLADSEEELIGRMYDATRFDLYAHPQRGEYIALQHPYSSFADTL